MTRATTTLSGGARMHQFATELFPLCRSITGPGIRETLSRIADHVPLTWHEVPSGAAVLDWVVPNEWTIRDAYVANAAGGRVIDFGRSNLHVINYSAPMAGQFSLEELRPHLHAIPEHPDWIPYKTSYYRETWGFCLAQRVLEALPAGRYNAVIDADLKPGKLVYGECHLPGREEREVLISTHCCHPSLANDNLSGIVVASALAQMLAARERRLSYRILFVPGTIGALAWLDRNRNAADRVVAGLVLSCLGDQGPLRFKQSRRGQSLIDRAVRHLFAARGLTGVRSFVPTGYDERQYCSPGFDLPVGSLTRTPNGQYAEYHTSADDMSLVHPAALEDSLSFLRDLVDLLEGNRRVCNQVPFGEPQLGRRGLFRTGGGRVDAGRLEEAMLWVLNGSDGSDDLLEVANRSGLPFPIIVEAARQLEGAGLISEQSIAAR